MELQELIIIIVATLAGIGGLILVWLQKKEIVKPILTQNANGFDLFSGGSIVLFATVIGAYILFKYEKVLAILYIVIFGGLYVLIFIFDSQRKNGKR